MQSIDISNVSGCLKTKGVKYVGKDNTYGPNDLYAQVRAVAKYTCPHGGRSQTMGELGVCAPHVRVSAPPAAMLRPRRPPPTASPLSLCVGIWMAAGRYESGCKPTIYTA